MNGRYKEVKQKQVVIGDFNMNFEKVEPMRYVNAKVELNFGIR